jgi:S1-C subfamily serine protease
MYGSLVDVILIALVIIFAVNGYRQGFVIGLLSFVGFFGGAAIGLQLGPFLANYFNEGVARVFISLLTVLAVAIGGQAVASLFGARLRSSIRNPTGRTLDDLGGALVSMVAVLLVAWLVAAPDPQLAGSAVVTRAQRSVVKILGTAGSCSRRIEGSGFVYSSQHVITNAHVVAGTDSVSVESGGNRRKGQVVVYDAEKDLAVIYVPGLTAPAIRFAPAPAKSGDNAIVLGFPLDGPFDVQPARIRDLGPIRGPDIYEAHTVTRDIYTLRGLVRSGNSGGPLIDEDGDVLGVIFAAAADDKQTGFALSDSEASPVIEAGRGATGAVGTGSCAQG